MYIPDSKLNFDLKVKFIDFFHVFISDLYLLLALTLAYHIWHMGLSPWENVLCTFMILIRPRTLTSMSNFKGFYDMALFVYLKIIGLLENFSLVWRRRHCRWKAVNFDLCLALMAIEQWGFFSVPHLLWHGAFVYDGHLQGPVTLTAIAERPLYLPYTQKIMYNWYEYMYMN